MYQMADFRTPEKPSTWRVRSERPGAIATYPAHLAQSHPLRQTQTTTPSLCCRGLPHSPHTTKMATTTMATITTKPVVNGSLLPPRTPQVGSCCKPSWVSSPRGQLRCSVRFLVRASDDSSGGSSVVGQTPTTPIETGNSVTEVKDAETGPVSPTPVEAAKPRKPSSLQKGGTLEGDDEAAAGKKAPAAVDAAKFDDPRWRAGTWDITKFASNGKINWDAVIDAEVARRKWLEDNPEASNDREPVVFDTATVPWWAWVKRFHLPEAELLNGRAAMVGYAVGYLVDSATGVGLVDQQSSFLGKTLLVLVVLGVLLIRKNSDVGNLRTIAKESTFYDKQWQATWKDDDAEADKKDNSNIP